MSNHDRQLDTGVRVVTPENIAFQYRVAGPFRRLSAYLIDLVIRVVVSVAALFGLTLLFELIGLKSWGFGIALVFFAFPLMWFYGGVFETFWNGQTPGKRIFRLRVLSVEGQAINASQAVLRNVLRVVDSFPWPLFYLVGLIAASMNNRFQRLGDLACGTMVVWEQAHGLQGVAKVSESEVIRLGAAIPAGFQPSRSLSRSLAMYVGRRNHFTPARRVQIARYVGIPLREQFKLPQNTNLDHLLCALYNRAFVADDESESPDTMDELPIADGENPFAPPMVEPWPAEEDTREPIPTT